MEIVVIVLGTIIATAVWSVFWARRLWRQWRGLWGALKELFGVLDELQRVAAAVADDTAQARRP